MTNEDPLVNYLLGLKNREDRGALAALRTGLGKKPGEAPRMFPHVGRFITSSDPARASVATAFATASLFTIYPEQTAGRSLGLALWHATKRDGNPSGKHGEPGVEARFTAMIDAHEDDIVRHLHGLISLCESASQGLDWYRFRRDLSSLLSENETRRDNTRLSWARDFWQGPRNETTSQLIEGQN